MYDNEEFLQVYLELEQKIKAQIEQEIKEGEKKNV